MLLKQRAVEVRFLGGGRVDGEANGRPLHLAIAHLRLGMVAQAVDPPIADAIAELLLLAVQDELGQESFEGLTDDGLLDFSLAAHLGLGVESHGIIDEFAVEEGHSGFDAPGHHGFVGAGAIVLVQAEDLSDGLLVELALVRGHVEVEVAAKQLVRAFAAQDHLDAHRLDFPGHQVHRSGGPDSGHVVGLDVADDFTEGVEAFLNREVQWMVHSADGVRDLLRGREVGRSLQADGEAVDAGPPSLRLLAIVDPVFCEFHGDGGDDGTVEAARDEQAVWYVAH